MKRDVSEFVTKCLVYQRVKAEHQVPSRLLQPIRIPEWKWDRITMDFVTDRLKPFFSTLMGAHRADWNQECNQALIEIKQYLTEPPVLVSLEAGDTLYIYLAVSEILVSTKLFKEDESRKQRPIFIVSKSLSEAETRYTRFEQAILTLWVDTKNFVPTFRRTLSLYSPTFL